MKRVLGLLTIGIVLASSCAIGLTTKSASAVTHTCMWIPSSSGNFTDPSNWSSCVSAGGIPADGDSLIFPATTSSKNINYDDTGKRFAHITVNGDYDFSGNTLPVSGDITVAAGTSDIFEQQIDITTASPVTISLGGVSGQVSFTGGFNLAMGTQQLSFTEPDGSQTIYIGGDIVGTLGTLSFSNLSALLFGTNTFTTSVGINANSAALYCETTGCLGDASNDLTMTNAGQINYDQAGTYPNDMTIDQGSIAPRVVGVVCTGNIDVTGDSNLITISGANIDIQGDITLDNANISFYNADSTTEYIHQSGDILGTGDVIVAGNYTSQGTNTFTGNFQVHQGGAAYLTNLASVSPDADFIVDNGGSLRTDATGTLDNDFSLAGNGRGTSNFLGALDFSSTTGNLTLTGNIDLAANARIAATSSGTPRELHLNGVISGDFDLELNVPTPSGDPIFIGGTNPNTYNNLHVVGAAVELIKTGAVPKNVIADTTAGNNTSSSVIVNAPGNAIGGSVDVIGSPFDSSGGSSDIIFEGHQEISGLTGTGIVALAADSHLTINNATTDTFDGIFSDDSGSTGDRIIVKAGAGKFISTNTFPTNWFLSFPVVFQAVDGTTSFTNTDNNQMNVFVEGGTVSGTGVVGSLTEDSGHVAPGNSPGCLTSAGDVDFGALSSSLDIDLGGTTVCSGYDQVISGTDIDLNSTTLNVNLYGGFASKVGDVFTIVRAPNVHGTFSGLVDGGLYKNSGVTYRINYNEGLSGEDSVTLTVVAVDGSGTLPTTGVDSTHNMEISFALMLLGSMLTFAMLRRRRFMFSH